MAGNPVRRAWLTQPGGLATRLSGLRADAGLSVSGLARQLGWERTKVSRIGSGVIAPTAHEIRAWCSTVKADDQADELVDLLRQMGAASMPWRQRIARGQHSNQAAYTKLHTAAVHGVTMVETGLIPGALQIPAYARAVLQAFATNFPDLPLHDLDAAVEARMERANLVRDPKRRYEFIISEACLVAGPVPADIMADQLEYILEVADQTNIGLWVIPLKLGLAAIHETPFRVYRLPDEDLILAATPIGETELPASTDWAQVGDGLKNTAVTDQEALDLVRSARTTLESSLSGHGRAQP